MGNLSRSEKIGIVSIVALIALVALGPYLRSLIAPSPGIVFQEAPQQNTVAPSLVSSSGSPSVPSVSPSETSAAPSPPSQIVVHVTGAVKKPGVYDLPLDSRVKDALQAAGGEKADANLDALNLAARVEDGAQLYLPTKKEQPKGLAQAAYEAGESPIIQTKPEPKKTVAPASTSVARAAPSRSSRSGKLMTPGQGTVNINTADAATLQKLPGIGPAMAERILTFRHENGGFQAPEDLLQVSGIGEKKFARMQAFIRVK